MNEQNNIFHCLNQIYSSNGKNKNSWKELIFSMNNFNSNPGIIHYFNQRIINEPSNILTLDILDFLIDFGPIHLLRELSKIDLMINIFNLLKKSSGSGPEVQKKGIYLTKKWFEIAKKYQGENFEGFIRNYQELNNKGISFPPPGYKLNTYEQYISIYEINNILTNSNSGKNKHQDINNSNEDFLNYNNSNINKNINKNFENNNSEITPFEQESKYNKNDDIPSNSMPQLNNYERNSNFEKINIFNNNRNNNSDDKMIDINNNINNEINNYNNSNKNYFERNEKLNNFNENNNQDMKGKGIENLNPFEDLNKKVKFPENFEDKFSDLKYSTFSDKPGSFIKNDNIENNKYPKYNPQQIKNNNKYPDNDIETPIGADLYCAPLFNNVISTPLGNKNPIPITNKHYNTIYNNGFKSYMDVKYGPNNNKNNNNINNNFNNNINNNYNNNFNNIENDNKFNKPKNINNIHNNQNQIKENNNYKDPNNPAFLYQHSWSLKIAMYNDWIDKGSNDTNEEQLKNGIRTVLFEFNKIESLLQKYNKEGDFESVNIIQKLKSDMSQTCYRYERYVNNQSYDKFYSAFDGNNNSYNFNKEFLLSYIVSKDHNINNKYVEGIKKFGGAMKKGIFTAGKVVKENTVKGFNFVKEKVHRDKNNETNLNKQNNNANINDYSKSSDFTYYNNNNFNNNFHNQNNNITPNPINNQANNFNSYNINNFNYNYNNYNNFNNTQNINNNNENFY